MYTQLSNACDGSAQVAREALRKTSGKGGRQRLVSGTELVEVDAAGCLALRQVLRLGRVPRTKSTLNRIAMFEASQTWDAELCLTRLLLTLLMFAESYGLHSARVTVKNDVRGTVVTPANIYAAADSSTSFIPRRWLSKR